MTKLSKLLVSVMAFSLFTAACSIVGSGDDSADEGGIAEVQDQPLEDEGSLEAEPVEPLLGTIQVPAGQQIQIRSLNVISGGDAEVGVASQRAAELAIADYGRIEGFDVTMGLALEDLCGDTTAVQSIVADEQIVGVVGTPCSDEVGLSISEADMVLISPSDASPELTSDQRGNEASGYSPGTYRTAPSGLLQATATAEFAFGAAGFTTAAAVHDGGAYSEALALAFVDAFEELGGEASISSVSQGDLDLSPTLTAIAEDNPQALFFPLAGPAGTFIADQVPNTEGLENTVLLTADGLLNDGFMALEQSEGLYFSAPESRFGTNENESTGKTAEDVVADYEAAYGDVPAVASWGYAYDATTLLLDAIAASAVVEGDTLVIDRADVRSHLDSIIGYSGIVGTLNCDEFGDCGSGKIVLIQHLSVDDIEASKDNVVFEYVPER